MSRALGQVGVVAIGRNEGERLKLCLESIPPGVAAVVYVDSGSTDGSIEMARARGATVVELDMSVPFSAARARNEGIEALRRLDRSVAFVQVVDGDCELCGGWIEAALDAIEAEPRRAVVCGRRRERFPEHSAYNALCDMEWNTPVGTADSCGGDALIRLVALDEVGGYDGSIIAGEEPEMCLRLRRAEWTILRVDHEMTLHDADMRRFVQWWRRAVRAGHAYAEGFARHGRGPERFNARELLSILAWGLLGPVAALALAWWTYGISVLLMVMAYGALWLRVRRHRLRAGDPPDRASLYARSCVVGKFAQLVGAARYFWNRLRGRKTGIIEYKEGTKGRRHEGTEEERATERPSDQATKEAEKAAVH
jgi:glycosyltransferase involved in cell wall biosynthesis